MVKVAILFLLGNVALHSHAHLPSFIWLLCLWCLLWPAARWKPALWLILPLLGYSYAWMHAQLRLADRLPGHLEGKDLVITGLVSSLPDRTGGSTRFQFDVDGGPDAEKTPRRLLLTWYAGDNPPAAGERRRLVVRLKRPRGFRNPGLFDRETLLFRRNVRATGYVRRSDENVSLPGTVTDAPLLRMRSAIRSKLRDTLRDDPFAGVVTGLTVGSREGVTADQWRVFRATGTGHLMAISGLHIGLVAGFGALLGAGLGRLSAPAFSGTQTASAAGLAAALGYALLAGFSVSTQRALIMLFVVFAAVLMRRPLTLGNGLATAGLLVLLTDPYAPLSPGFWLSFVAVASIALGVAAQSRTRWPLVTMQFRISMGLLPVILWAFGEVSLVSPLVNLVLIPVFATVLVPLVLAGTVMLFVWPWLGTVLLVTGTGVLARLWPLLESVASWSGSHWTTGGVPLPAVLLAGVAAVVFFTPRGTFARGLVVLLLLPVVLWRSPVPAADTFEVTVLDVGQGLAVVIRTRSRVLVYDAGPRFQSGSDTGAIVVVPYLRSLGITDIDRLIVSHGDIDHRGGVESVLKSFPDAQVFAGGGVSFSGFSPHPCRAGHRWRWDGVEFAILHPRNTRRARNDGSCVLRVGAGSASVLLTGDIEESSEKRLTDGSLDLESGVVVVPHHGSTTSSSPDFVAAVSPRYALVSAGYRNRWGFPKPEVTARWREAGATVVSTSRSGAVTVFVDTRNGLIRMEIYTQSHGRYWHSEP